MLGAPCRSFQGTDLWGTCRSAERGLCWPQMRAVTLTPNQQTSPCHVPDQVFDRVLNSGVWLLAAWLPLAFLFACAP